VGNGRAASGLDGSGSRRDGPFRSRPGHLQGSVASNSLRSRCGHDPRAISRASRASSDRAPTTATEPISAEAGARGHPSAGRERLRLTPRARLCRPDRRRRRIGRVCLR
jgi:hypothetical protein